MLFRKKETEIVQCFSLLWEASEEIVRFSNVFELIKESSLTVVDMTYHKANQFTDNRNVITYHLKGTIQNLELFEIRVLNSKKLDIFKGGES